MGITYDQLSSEEKQTFNLWRDALSGRKLTDEDVGQFFDIEYNDAVKKLAVAVIDSREDMFLKMKIDFIIKTKEFLSIPAKERAMVEQHINSQT